MLKDLKFLESKTRILNFNILGSCPWILKVSIWIVLARQTLKLKMSISSDISAACKKIWIQKLQIQSFQYPAGMVLDAKIPDFFDFRCVKL